MDEFWYCASGGIATPNSSASIPCHGSPNLSRRCRRLVQTRDGTMVTIVLEFEMPSVHSSLAAGLNVRIDFLPFRRASLTRHLCRSGRLENVGNAFLYVIAWIHISFQKYSRYWQPTKGSVVQHTLGILVKCFGNFSRDLDLTTVFIHACEFRLLQDENFS